MPELIELRSDNAAGVAPEILAALADADRGSALAYGGDAWTTRLHEVVGAVFEHPSPAVFPVVSGTAANSLGLAALCPPWGAVLCHETAHVLNSECGATSAFSGGAVLQGVGGDGSLIDPAHLAHALESAGWGDPHHSQPAVLSLTLPTDRGAVYGLDHLRELTAIARRYGLKVHLDGARLANALVALDAEPADVTWRAGVDMFSLGATKNGAMSTDAIVSFDPAAAQQLLYRTKRSGHVASKMRYQSAQLIAYLDGGRWLELAGAANAAMHRLAQGLTGLGVALHATPRANMAFVHADDELAGQLEAAGLLFYRIEPGTIRFVTSFRTTMAEVDEVLARVAAALRPRTAASPA